MRIRYCLALIAAACTTSVQQRITTDSRPLRVTTFSLQPNGFQLTAQTTEHLRFSAGPKIERITGNRDGLSTSNIAGFYVRPVSFLRQRAVYADLGLGIDAGCYGYYLDGHTGQFYIILYQRSVDGFLDSLEKLPTLAAAGNLCVDRQSFPIGLDNRSRYQVDGGSDRVLKLIRGQQDGLHLNWKTITDKQFGSRSLAAVDDILRREGYQRADTQLARIGEGVHSRVYAIKVVDQYGSPEIVAVKKRRKSSDTDSGAFTREASWMHAYRSDPDFIQLIGHVDEPQRQLIISKYAGQSVYDAWDRVVEIPGFFDTLSQFFFRAEGKLAQDRISYLEWKIEHVAIGRVKGDIHLSLLDFGDAERHNGSSSKKFGPIGSMPPEFFKEGDYKPEAANAFIIGMAIVHANYPGAFNQLQSPSTFANLSQVVRYYTTIQGYLRRESAPAYMQHLLLLEPKKRLQYVRECECFARLMDDGTYQRFDASALEYRSEYLQLSEPGQD